MLFGMSAEPSQPGYPAERTKAFIDAAVAIALTLLILPLMESVGEVAGEGEDALTWLQDHRGQLVSFVLSFVLIALFWLIHHHLFTRVERLTPRLFWLLAAWMLTIVWLPVATAVSGRMEDSDDTARALYIGSLALTALASLGVRLYVRAHPALHSVSDDEMVRAVALDLSLLLLFGAALLIGWLVPAIGYFALLLTMLSGVVQKLLRRMLGARSV